MQAKTGFNQAGEKECHQMMGMRCRNKLKGIAEQFANTWLEVVRY
jgi:hypothetical protein